MTSADEGRRGAVSVARRAATWACALAAAGLLALGATLLRRTERGEGRVDPPAATPGDVEVAPGDDAAPSAGDRASPAAPFEVPAEAARDEERPYTVRIESVETRHATSDESVMTVECRCALEYPWEGKAGDQPLLAVLDPAVLTDGESDLGDRLTSGHTYRTTRAARPRATSVSFRVRTTVPADCKGITFLEGIVTRLVPLGRGSVRWDDPAKQKGEERSSDGFDFSLARFGLERSAVAADVLYKVPEGKPWEPRSWRSGLVACEVLFDDGSVRGASGWASSGGGGWSRKRFRCSRGGRTPVAVRVSFVTAIEQERLRFRLADVRLPGPAKRPRVEGSGERVQDVPAGPRGDDACVAEGFTFRVSRAEVIRTLQEGETKAKLRVTLKVKFPEERKVFAVSAYPLSPAAADDLGTKLTGETRLYMRTPRRLAKDYDETLSVYLSAPHDLAGRLISFTGEYRAFVAGASATERFPLPGPSGEFGEPVRRGPVALVAYGFADDTASVAVEVDEGAFPEKGSWWLRGVKLAILDEAGEALKRKSGGGVGFAGKRPSPARFTLSSLGEGRAPATLVVTYPTDCAVRDVPFRFENVGLPGHPPDRPGEDEVF